MKVRPDMQLFGGHTIYTIEEKQWIKIPLDYLHTLSKTDIKNIDLMIDFPIEGLHYYCETADITRPFPSPNIVNDYVGEFCWNDWLASPFTSVGLRSWCVVLLQGMAESKIFPGSGTIPDGNLFLFIFINIIY